MASRPDLRAVGAISALLLLGAAPAPQTATQLVDDARARLEANDFAGAIDLSGRAIALAPTNPDVLLLAANLVRDRFGLTAALPWYDRVLQIKPDDIPALIDKAATLGDAGQSIACLAVTRQILALDPGQPMALYLQSVLAARAGKWEVARALLYRTDGALDDLAAVTLLRGAIALQTGATESAIATLSPLVETQPGNRHARRLLGLALWRSNDDQGALDTLQPIADDGDAWVLTVMARAAEAIGDRAWAVNLLDRAANPPAHGPAWQGGGQGDVMMAAGQWPAAVAFFARSANVRFTQATAFRLIYALGRAGQGDAAGAVLTTLIAQNPASLPALRLAASDALSRREWARAATALEAVRNRTGNRDVLLLGKLSWADYNLGRGADALKYARRAYATATASALAAADYGWLLVKTGDKASGVPLLQKAVATMPGYAPFRAKLAEAQKH
jgi:predicted Zn-dependent protease